MWKNKYEEEEERKDFAFSSLLKQRKKKKERKKEKKYVPCFFLVYTWEKDKEMTKIMRKKRLHVSSFFLFDCTWIKKKYWLFCSFVLAMSFCVSDDTPLDGGTRVIVVCGVF